MRKVQHVQHVQYPVIDTITTYGFVHLYDSECPSSGKCHTLAPGTYNLYLKPAAGGGNWWIVKAGVLGELELGLAPSAWRSMHIGRMARLENFAVEAAMLAQASDRATALVQA